MNLMNLVDGPSAVIVLGGTLLATMLRSGIGDCRFAVIKLAQLGSSRFDASAARSELAQQVQEIHKDGLLRAVPHHFGDSEFDAMGTAWLTHNVEEVSMFEHILPSLYAARTADA